MPRSQRTDRSDTTPADMEGSAILRDLRRASWVLPLPARWFARPPRPETRVIAPHVYPIEAHERTDGTNPVLMALLIASWFAALLGVLWHLLVTT